MGLQYFLITDIFLIIQLLLIFLNPIIIKKVSKLYR